MIERLTLAEVTRVPPSHPEHETFEPFPVHAWLIRHPDGPILVDTGVGHGHDEINDRYGLTPSPLPDDVAAVVAVVLSHLHFDHCGQQGALDCPVFVQAAEWEAAKQPRYTIPEWAAIPDARRRLVHGDEEIAQGVRVIATPGHTQGHQSVVVETPDGRVVLAAQSAFRAEELESGEPSPRNLESPQDAGAARESLAKIRALAPAIIHFSHDPTVLRV